jgi:hypothetical protein
VNKIREKYRAMVREITGRLVQWLNEVITDPSECEKITAGIERNSKFKALKEVGFCFSPANSNSAKGAPCRCVYACHPKV